MKLKAQLVFDAVPVISTIIREKRPLPQKGKYRLARMHAKLLSEYNTLAERRDAMIMAYDSPLLTFHSSEEDPIGQRAKPSGKYTVPEEKLSEFTAAWKEIGDTEIEIADLEPIPLDQLSLSDDANGAIEAVELITLGDLVKE